MLGAIQCRTGWPLKCSNIELPLINYPKNHTGPLPPAPLRPAGTIGELSIFDFYSLLTSGCGPNPLSFQAKASTSPGTWKCTIAGGVNSKKIESSGPKRSIAFSNASHESPSGEQVTNTPPGNRFRASCSCSLDLAFRTFQCADIRRRDREGDAASVVSLGSEFILKDFDSSRLSGRSWVIA
jgi:hypothetical protein